MPQTQTSEIFFPAFLLLTARLSTPSNAQCSNTVFGDGFDFVFVKEGGDFSTERSQNISLSKDETGYSSITIDQNHDSDVAAFFGINDNGTHFVLTVRFY